MAPRAGVGALKARLSERARELLASGPHVEVELREAVRRGKPAVVRSADGKTSYVVVRTRVEKPKESP
jgi:hypothetical protein